MYQEYVDGIKKTLDALSWDSLDRVVTLLHDARIAHRRVFIFGNGGSASTAQHMACDLNKNTRVDDLPGFRVMCLSDNTALFSAFANDEGYQSVFSSQLALFAEPGDVALAISASGNSANILKAVSVAKSMGATTIGWSGYDGGELAKIVDYSIVVPNHCIEQIEDIHLMLEHMVTSAVRTRASAPSADAGSAKASWDESVAPHHQHHQTQTGHVWATSV